MESNYYAPFVNLSSNSTSIDFIGSDLSRDADTAAGAGRGGGDGSPVPPTSVPWTFVVAKCMMRYVLPVIIITGLLGNTASFLVFLGRDLRKLSSSVYVMAALTSDIGLLIGLLFVWFEVLGLRLNHEEGACQFLVFLSFACSFLSVWYTVCITIENYIAICHPTRVKTLCTRKRATVVVTVLAVATLPLYILSAASTEVTVDPVSGTQFCDRKQNEYVNEMHVLIIVDSVITLLVPLVCVTAMLIAIILSIVHTYRWRRSSPGSQKHRAELMSIPQVRVAKMLFALSLSFVVMNSPSHVCRLYYLMASMGGGFPSGGGAGGEGGIGGGGGDVVSDDLEQTEGAGGGLLQQKSADPEISMEEGLVQLVLLYGSYCYYSVKFILFITFSKNFRRSIRESCEHGTGGGGGPTCLRKSSPEPPSSPVDV